MKYVFVVQGEGRGHMTQAISLAQILQGAGHEVSSVIVGKSPRRKIPQFFFDRMDCPVIELESPNFVTDKHQKSVKPVKSLAHSLVRGPQYKKSIAEIHKIVTEDKPDVIVNFYDFLGGLYNFFERPKSRFVSLAHQYLLSHPEFTFPTGRIWDKASILMANQITSLRSDRILALSFQPFDHQPDQGMFVVPPLLRDEVKSLKPTKGDSILAYMVNPGYGEEVQRFHEQHPEISLDCFWDMRDKPREWKVDDTLTFHQLDDQKFIEKMADCRGYITTAGFESVCEAMYLGKPAMMIPVEGHYEQACNAVDAEKAGAGISNDTFDIAKLVDYIPRYEDTSSWFGDWARQNRDYFLKYLTDW